MGCFENERPPGDPPKPFRNRIDEARAEGYAEGWRAACFACAGAVLDEPNEIAAELACFGLADNPNPESGDDSCTCAKTSHGTLIRDSYCPSHGKEPEPNPCKESE
jgi:hypothetical protein